MSDRERSPARSESSYQMNDLDNKLLEQSPPRVRQSRSPSPGVRLEGRRHSYSRSRSPAGGKRGKMSSSFRGDRERGGGGGGGGTRYRSRSRSRSPRRAHKGFRSRSRSRSRRDFRSHSRSPMSNRRRHQGSRDNPEESTCLGVFGLSIYTPERDLHDVFSKYGPIDKIQVVIDAKTGRSRGFAFVYFSSKEDARVAKDRCSGMEIDGRRIRVDYSITKRAHTPTPGIYMGKPTEDHRGGGGRSPDRHGGSSSGSRRHRPEGDGYGGGDRYRERDRYNRSPSPCFVRSRRSRNERSRSRSYSRYESGGIG